MLLRRLLWPPGRVHALAGPSLAAVRASSSTELPRLYHDVNVHRPREYWDYEDLNVNWGHQQDYEIVKKIGRGKYSEVFAGTQVASGEACVIKVLKPVRKSKIKREIRILQNLCGGPNIVRLLDVLRDPVSNTTSLVFEYVSNTNFRVMYRGGGSVNAKQYLQYYTYELLKALDYCHSQGIMHRDVKPQNVMVDHPARKIRLIDWGLADFYHPGREYNVRVASRYYKGPELLVDLALYHYALDTWSLGVMLAGMVFQQDPFFRGADNDDQLYKIARVLGTNGLYDYLDKYGLKLETDVASVVDGYRRQPWEAFVHDGNKHLAQEDAIDLIDKMLVYDHADRILPKEAMQHAFFQTVREQEAASAH